MSRNRSLDIIRCTALLFVFMTHFFTHIGFYSETVIHKRMLLMLFLRNLFITCVPLFLLLTGYLMNKKKWSLTYYKGLVKIILVYCVVSLFCYVQKNSGTEFSLRQLLGDTLSFNAAGYSWYVEMYIGLFLLIPILNSCYQHMENKKAIIVTMIILTAAPSVINVFTQVIPEWWQAFYPITYYFIGAYISDYAINYSKKKIVAILSIVWFVESFLGYLESYGKNFVWEDYSDYCGLFTLLLAVCIFLLILDKRNIKYNGIFIKIISHISKISLGMYLYSEIADRIVYPKVFRTNISAGMKLNYLIPVICAVFVISLIGGTVTNFIVDKLITVSERIYTGVIQRKRNVS